MSTDDRSKWNQRFAQREGCPPAPPAFAGFMQAYLQPGTLLDIACGDGALALHFAQQGWQTSGLDISEVALERLARFANQSHVEVATHCADLAHPLPSHIGGFDNIVIGRYKPDDHQWPAIISLLNSGGVLCISTFNQQQHELHGFSKRFCLESGELCKLQGLRLTKYQQAQYQQSHIDNYAFYKTR